MPASQKDTVQRKAAGCESSCVCEGHGVGSLWIMLAAVHQAAEGECSVWAVKMWAAFMRSLSPASQADPAV